VAARNSLNESFSNTAQRALEAEQVPAMDSVKLLQEEIEREELRIEHKRQLLASLEENAKTASQKQKKRVRTVCPVYPI
jgi:hypothetical protein